VGLPLFWTTGDLENKLLDFRTYFNNHRTHTSLEGRTPVTPVSRPIANLRSFRTGDPNTRVEGCQLAFPRTDEHECSTAPHGDVEIRRLRVTHPYHPLFQQEFELVSYCRNWGEGRAWFQDKLGRLQSFPTSWTDAGAVDPFVALAAGRSLFRVADSKLKKAVASWHNSFVLA
jgi:hypothetical protein